ncbi:MAG TPA: cation:proton antiporter [Candidatus Dormibacteraeota bacterium]|nr:cation:proton antiporter [Candidatus Dormibacteraeota bacterium]
MPNLFILTLQLAVVLAVCRVVGWLFQKIHQPKVVGEMFAGIMLGPSLLGWMAPHLSSYLFPASSLGFLNALSQVGVVVFMFLVGLGINPGELKKEGHAAVLTSHVSITAPFVLAAFLALYLYPRLSDDSVAFTSFALFMGAAMSITAFPVLARILAERDMLGSRLGTVAIACAAVDDVTGWCILAYIVVLIRSAHSATSIWVTIGGILVFALAMIHGVRRLLRGFERAYRKKGALSENLMALMLLLVLASSLFTEYLGIHLLFGAFLMGAIMPKESRFVRYVLDRFETITVTLLLPLFFAFTGLRTNIAAVKGPEMWMYCGLIVLVATAGKLGGSTLASWLSGMPLREAAGLGTLMNTRGLMELVILNIGLDIGVISPALFSMMVMMALVTTFMTTPVLSLICPKEMLQGAAAKSAAERVAAPPVSLHEGEGAAA